MMWSRAFLTSITFGLFLPTQSKDEQDWTGIVLLGKMSESTSSSWSLSIHVPRGGVWGDHSAVSRICSIGVHLRENVFEYLFFDWFWL